MLSINNAESIWDENTHMPSFKRLSSWEANKKWRAMGDSVVDVCYIIGSKCGRHDFTVGEIGASRNRHVVLMVCRRQTFERPTISSRQHTINCDIMTAFYWRQSLDLGAHGLLLKQSRFFRQRRNKTFFIEDILRTIISTAGLGTDRNISILHHLIRAYIRLAIQ